MLTAAWLSVVGLHFTPVKSPCDVSLMRPSTRVASVSMVADDGDDDVPGGYVRFGNRRLISRRLSLRLGSVVGAAAFVAVARRATRVRSQPRARAALDQLLVPSADAVYVLPKPEAQVEASASRARALSALPTYPILESQRNIEALLADEETFRTCVALGLPTGRLQMPTILEGGIFLNLELGATEPDALRAAAAAYAVDAAKANEYLAYAEGAQMDKDLAEVTRNLDVAFSAVQRCKVSLQRVVAAAARS